MTSVVGSLEIERRLTYHRAIGNETGSIDGGCRNGVRARSASLAKPAFGGSPHEERQWRENL